MRLLLQGLCQFLASGDLSDRHPDWDASESFKWKTFNAEEPLDTCGAADMCGRAAMRLSHGFRLANSVPELMEFTWLGHVREYGMASLVCVDHIFYGMDHLSLSSLVPIATKEFVEEHSAPSSVFASDHAAVVVDFDFVVVE